MHPLLRRVVAVMTTAILVSGLAALVSPAEASVVKPCRKVAKRVDAVTSGRVMARCLSANLVRSSPVKIVLDDGERSVGRYDYRNGMKVHVRDDTGGQMLIYPTQAWLADPETDGGRWNRAVSDSDDVDQLMAYAATSMFRAYGNPRSIAEVLGRCPELVSRGHVPGGIAFDCVAPFSTELLGFEAVVSSWRVVLNSRTMLTKRSTATATAAGIQVTTTQRFSRWGRPYDFDSVRREAIRQAG